MLIRNLTGQVQEILVNQLGCPDPAFSIYIQPYGSTDLDKSFRIVDQHKIGHVIALVSDTTQIPAVAVLAADSQEIKSISSAESEKPADPVEETSLQESDEPEVLPDRFICDECGAEFASARGLNSHKTKAHNHE